VPQELAGKNKTTGGREVPVPFSLPLPVTHASMEGRDNGDRGSWRSRYRDHTTRGSGRSTSSSGGYTSAGTIVSTGYTSNSSRRLSSFSSLKAAIHLDLELDEDRWLSQPTKKSRKEIDTSKETQKKEKMYHHQRSRHSAEGDGGNQNPGPGILPRCAVAVAVDG
jgi:hypothetical protein